MEAEFTGAQATVPHGSVSLGTSNGFLAEPSFQQIHALSSMDSQSKVCQDLSNQLAIYRAFNNRHAVAAVMRQMAFQHCPINVLKQH